MGLKKRTCRRETGVTLLELLIAMAILGIIISVAIPSFSDAGDSQRLIGATEQLFNHIQQARSEAIAGNTTGYINFNAPVAPTAASSTWQYGVSTVNSLCDLTVTDPTLANACVIIVDNGDGTTTSADYVLMRFTNSDWTGVSMQINSFSSSTTQIVFDPVRGTSTDGQINLTSANGKLLRIEVSLLGRPTICSPDGSIPNYKTC